MTVKVKPLVWRQDADGDYLADHPFGCEAIVMWRSNGLPSYEALGMDEDFPTLEAAKAAAQADYEARILAALEAPAQEPVASRTARPVKVKPLVWVHGAGFGKQEHSYADTELGTWCMTAYSGRGGRWAYTDPCGNDSEDDWLTRDECQTAVEAAREARVFAELETDQAALTQEGR